MGTVGSYTGGGGPDGDELRDNINEWLDRLPQAPPAETDGPADQPAPGQPVPGQSTPTRAPLDPRALLAAVGLLRPRSSSGGGADGPGGGGGGGTTGGGGASRSAAASAGTAGRAAAGAYAFATGDTDTLARLGLDYGELRSIGDRIEVVRAIVSAAFESQPPDSSIPDHEQRLVAADVADWVIAESEAGHTPVPEDIVRRTIAGIIAQVILVETGDVTSSHPAGAMTEDDIVEAAEVLAGQAELSVEGATETEFAQAIEDGIETLRAIREAGK